MKKIVLVLFLIIGIFSIYGENKVSITADSTQITASIGLNKSEYVILNEDFLFMRIESNKYDFVFSGYPDGDLQEDGNIYYSGELILKGFLILKDGIPPGDYSVNIILGFQTCDKKGVCNIPVEISEEILIKEKSNSSDFIIVSLLVFVIAIILFLVIRRRKS